MRARGGTSKIAVAQGLDSGGSTRSWTRRRLLALIAGGIAGSAAAPLAPWRRAAAADDYPWKDEEFDSGLSPLRFYYRNCTDFVAWRLNVARGGSVSDIRFSWASLPFPKSDRYPRGDGNARGWMAGAEAAGCVVDTTPARGAIAWRGPIPYDPAGPIGHVAVVAKVNGDGTIDVEDYNADRRGSYRYASSIAPSRFTRYLHIADLPTTGEVVGQVVGVDGPLADVSVVLFNSRRSYSAITGPRGGYRLADVRPGSYTLFFAPGGMYMSETWKDVIPGDYEELTPVVVRSGDRLRRDAALELGVTLGGRVVDDAGRPLAGVTAKVFRPEGGCWLLTTQADGRYQVSRVRPGTYYVQFLADRDRPEQRRLADEGWNDHPAWELDPIVMRPGQTRLNVNAEMQRMAAVAGTVRRSDGSPARWVSVRMMHVGGGTAYATTDESGRFRFTRVKPGRVRLRVVTYPTDPDRGEYYHNAATWAEARIVDVPPGTLVDGIAIRLARR